MVSVTVRFVTGSIWDPAMACSSAVTGTICGEAIPVAWR
jgi:hypothetical protein